MKQIKILSLRECIDFTLEAPVGPPYIIISIQDTQNKGFGIQFTPTNICKAVHTVYFDDIDVETPNLKLITDAQAKEILEFVRKYDNINTIIIHCLHGQCRSAGVGAALAHIYNGDNSEIFKTKIPNRYVYRKIMNNFYT